MERMLTDLLEGTGFEGEFVVHYERWPHERILLNAIPTDNEVTSLMLDHIENGEWEKVGPLAMFLGRMMLNVHPEVRHDLFEFLCRHDHRLAADGRFYAFKDIGRDECSHHSGSEPVYVDAEEYFVRIPNPDGAIVSVKSRPIDDALQLQSVAYARKHSASGYVMKVVLVDPEYVLWVPRGDADGRMRTGMYEVIETYDSRREYGLPIL